MGTPAGIGGVDVAGSDLVMCIEAHNLIIFVMHKTRPDLYHSIIHGYFGINLSEVTNWGRIESCR